MTHLIEQLLDRLEEPKVLLPLPVDSSKAGDSSDEPPPNNPDDAIHWMNQRHFVVSEAGKTIVLTEEMDPEVRRRVLKRSSFEDVRKFYCNRFVLLKVEGERTKPAPLGQYWLNHERRRQYTGIVCAPRGDVPGYYNLWRGFGVEARPGDWSLMASHIEKIICGGSAEVCRYVRKWMAYAVQRPDTLPEVALVLRGKQGTGKGVFARGFGALFGQHFLHLARTRHLVGNFNAHLRDAIVVFADEAFLAGDKQSDGVLKAMISEPELTIERKFQDVVLCRNLIHLIVASNNDQIINAAAEERRFCVLDVSDARMKDHEYFAAIVNQMKNGGLEAMLYDLQQEGLSRFDPRQIPATEALQDQKIRSMSAKELWWFKRLQHGHLLGDDEEWPVEVVREELLEDYRIFIGQRNQTAQELRVALEKLLPKGYPRKGTRVSVGDVRKRTWVLPPLAECRDHLAKMFNIVDCWPDDAE